MEEGCFIKSWFGGTHENTGVCSVSQIPIQRIGLTNCSQNRHLCFAPPDDCQPMFGNVSDPTNKFKNDSAYFLFDFAGSSGDTYTLEKYNQVTKLWVEVAVLDNTQGVKYTFGDAIFNDKYDNRSGYRLDSYLVINLYGEGKYRFLVKNTVTYEDSLFSNCLCIKNWSCEAAKGTVKIYTNFSGLVSDWRLQEEKYNHDISCMEWIDSRRYCGVFKRESPEKETTTFIQANRKSFNQKTNTTSKFKLGLNNILREANNRLMYYGSESRDIFATDYNEDIVGASEHWTSIAMPNPYSSEEPAEINRIALSTFDCNGRYTLSFDRCISCEPAPDPIIIPVPVVDSPIAPTATIVLCIDTTSFSSSAAADAEDYTKWYVESFRIKYPDWTGDFVVNHIGFNTNSGTVFEKWLSWSRVYAKDKGFKDVVMIMFIDESNVDYHGIDPIVSTTPTVQYTTDYDNFIIDYPWFDSFKAMVYAVPTGNLESIPPKSQNPNEYPLNNWIFNMHNHVQCAIQGEIITAAQFIPSFQDTTNQLNIILTENNYDTLSSGGLKNFGWYEKHNFETGFSDLTYDQFKSDIDVMIDP